MVSKPHRNNSDFQLKYFIAGSCKTADGAWALLYGQRIDIEVKIKHSESQKLRRQAMIAKARAVIEDSTKQDYEKMEAQADIIEATAGEETWRLNLEAAIHELKTINELMDSLEPHRKFKDLPLLEANEACQQEEWRLELQTRAENFLITQGTIPHDHLDTMRCHPQFQSHIVPFIGRVTSTMRSLPSSVDAMRMLSSNNNNLQLLENK